MAALLLMACQEPSSWEASALSQGCESRLQVPAERVEGNGAAHASGRENPQWVDVLVSGATVAAAMTSLSREFGFELELHDFDDRAWRERSLSGPLPVVLGCVLGESEFTATFSVAASGQGHRISRVVAGRLGPTTPLEVEPVRDVRPDAEGPSPAVVNLLRRARERLGSVGVDGAIDPARVARAQALVGERLAERRRELIREAEMMESRSAGSEPLDLSGEWRRSRGSGSDERPREGSFWDYRSDR